MSAYAEYGTEHFSCRTPRDKDSPSRVFRCIRLDGKPTRVSNRNALGRSSFVAERLARLDRFHHHCPLFSVTQQPSRFASLCSPALTRSTALTLLKRISPSSLGGLTSNPLRIHELQRSSIRIGIDKSGPQGYLGKQEGGLRWGTSVAKPSSSVSGTLFSGERTRVLTPFREGSSRNFLYVRCGRFSDHNGFCVVGDSTGTQPQSAPSLLDFDPFVSAEVLCSHSRQVGAQ